MLSHKTVQFALRSWVEGYEQSCLSTGTARLLDRTLDPPVAGSSPSSGRRQTAGHRSRPSAAAVGLVAYATVLAPCPCRQVRPFRWTFDATTPVARTVVAIDCSSVAVAGSLSRPHCEPVRVWVVCRKGRADPDAEAGWGKQKTVINFILFSI